MKLDVRTRGQSDPRGKPRVYLTCHPDDFETAIPLISKDLLEHVNCAVWYDTELDQPVDIEELHDYLDQMQLVVLGVTSKFLRAQHRAKDVELKYALDRHIPVLPILLESGLAREFNKATDTKIQVVNRHVSDPTATPYSEVLETFLNAVLVSDELAERVRAAFDAYVFLSYRKKDRRYAHRLMRLIHGNELYRDIAIWYDEFLIPGENYNDAIKDAFEKSRLFALAVTPSLLEPDNYVMKVEYPMAHDRSEEKKDLEILPVEMYEQGEFHPGYDSNNERDIDEGRTDRAQLRESYKGLPPVQDEHRTDEMNAALLKALANLPLRENDGSAEHRFFIGLAYLCGIDVEINSQRALSLIESAANDPHPCYEATEKLVDMYLMGEGVAMNLRTAILWQEKLCGQYLEAYEAHGSPDEHKGYGTKRFRAMITLSDLLRDAGDLARAMEVAEQALDFSAKLRDEVGIREVARDTALICNRLGGLCRERGDIGQAAGYYKRAMEIYRDLAREIGTARARRDLSVSMERLGDMNRKSRDYGQAEQLYTQAHRIREELAGDGTNAGARRDLSAILTKLGNIRKSQKDLDGAAQRYGEALDIDRELAEEQKTAQAWDDYAVSLVKLGDIERAQMHTHDAVEHLERAVEIFSRNAEKTESVQYRRNLASGLEKLAKACAALFRQERAEKCYRQALQLREDLAVEMPSHTTKNELATTCYLYADFKQDALLMERALKLWEEMLSSHPEYRKYADSAREMVEKFR